MAAMALIISIAALEGSLRHMAGLGRIAGLGQRWGRLYGLRAAKGGRDRGCSAGADE